MRILARAVWSILVFMLNSLIFILIGIQMSDVVEKLNMYTLGHLLWLGLVVSTVAIAVRFAWVYPVAYLPRWLSGSLRESESRLRKRELGIISWCGMRGIVSIAAALALPVVLPNGKPFPQRELVIFITFFVIALTLVGQGLSLPPLIRKLKVGSDWDLHKEQQRVRAAMSTVALSAIDALMVGENAPREWADRLRAEITDRIMLAAPDGVALTPRTELEMRLRHAAIQAERRELIRLWRENEISDEVMHHLEEILDYQEAHL
jgi:CPA1 family monovalent cation:H+ antiporter